MQYPVCVRVFALSPTLVFVYQEESYYSPRGWASSDGDQPGRLSGLASPAQVGRATQHSGRESFESSLHMLTFSNPFFEGHLVSALKAPRHDAIPERRISPDGERAF